MNILTDLENLLREQLRRPGLTIPGDAPLMDLPGWDSLTHMTVMAAVEKHFGVEFSFEEISSLHTVNDLVQVLKLKTL